MSRLLPLLLFTTLSCLIPGSRAVNVFVASNTVSLKAGQYLNVSNVHLVVQPDCDLILYNDTNLPYMFTNTSIPGPSSARNCSLFMQTDANLVLYNFVNNNTQLTFENAIWNSQTDVHDNLHIYNFLLIKSNETYALIDYIDHENTRSLKAFSQLKPYVAPSNQSGTLTTIEYPFPSESSWKPESPLVDFPYMPAEYFLSQGFKLQTPVSEEFGQFVLELGMDCNLQSKKLNGSVQTILWETGTNSSENRGCQLTLQRDGRLELRGKNSSMLYWNSTNVTGDESVDWFLTLDYQTGKVSIKDISNLNKTAHWSNPVVGYSQGNYTSSHKIVWVVIGVFAGSLVALLSALGLFIVLVPSFLDPVEKEFRRRLETNGGQLQIFSQTKIRQATTNFLTPIGVGGFGDVFHGKLSDGQEIAAKVLSTTSKQSKEEFYNEIELLSKVHQKYLVSLLGYSCTRQHQVLVYEYMGGGDLRHRLRGLEYLHDKCSPSIIHRDVKSTNILLTNKMVAKVADFGLSKLRAIGQEDATHITTIVKGTPGYLDPEYHETGMLTDKSDVYAFGIVLLEILTGQDPMGIANRVREARKCKWLNDLVDPRLGGEYNADDFESLVELALWCVNGSSMERPFMRQVVQRFRELGLIASDVGLGEGSYYGGALEIISPLETDKTPLTESSGMSSESDAQFHSKDLQPGRSKTI